MTSCSTPQHRVHMGRQGSQKPYLLLPLSMSATLTKTPGMAPCVRSLLGTTSLRVLRSRTLRAIVTHTLTWCCRCTSSAFITTFPLPAVSVAVSPGRSASDVLGNLRSSSTHRDCHRAACSNTQWDAWAAQVLCGAPGVIQTLN